MPAGAGIVAHGLRVTAPGRAGGMPVPMPQVGEAAGADASSATLVDSGGEVLTNIHVQLIFWGTAWLGPATPSAAPVTNAVATILSSPYMSALAQYRGVGSGILRGSTTFTGSNPPNPFSNGDVTNLITSCIEAGVLPEPDDDGLLFYCVVMPPGVNSNQANVIGEHSFYWYTDYDFPFDIDINKAHYAWVTNNGTLAGVTTIFSHELVEAASDPEGSAIQLNAPGICSANANSWCEIGDLCNTTGVVAGVTVQSYWSQVDQRCVVPTGLPAWTSMGGQINGGLSAPRNADGRLEVFTRGTDGALWHIWQTARNNGWSGWDTLGGFILGRNVAARNADGRLEVFARGGDSALWHIWQTARNNGWSGWASLGGVVGELFDCGHNADGRLEVFARGSDGALWHNWQVAPNNGWSGWYSFGGQIRDVLAVASNADGRLEVFAKGTDGAVWHIWQTSPNNGWSGWASLGGSILDLLAVGNNADGRLEVFARGLDSGLWHIWQTSPNNGWSGWGSLGGSINDVLTVSNDADGRLEVFARGTDNALWHVWQVAPNNGWSSWGTMGGQIADLLAVDNNADGRLETFVRGFDNGLWHVWQTVPSNGWNN